MEQPGAVAGAMRFEFTGRAGEYFLIWIANVFLTIITLGIYSAWAKVRRNRYLYSSTRLAGASFDYLATPMQILKGRLIAVGLLAVYMASGAIHPLLQTLEGLIFLGFLPWLVIRARAFTLRHSAYRNITFGFRAGYGEAAAVYLLWPFLAAITLGILYPLYMWKRAGFAIANSRFGAQPLAFTAGRGGFFLVYAKFLGLLIAVVAGAGILVTIALTAEDARVGLAVLVVAIAVPALLATLSYVHVNVTNLVWSNIGIAGMSVRSTLKTPAMFWIALSSMIMIMLSFGLLIPWATIRMARYRVGQMSLLQAEGLQELLGSQPADVGSAGEELSDLLGIDVAI